MPAKDTIPRGAESSRERWEQEVTVYAAQFHVQVAVCGHS